MRVKVQKLKELILQTFHHTEIEVLLILHYAYTRPLCDQVIGSQMKCSVYIATSAVGFIAKPDGDIEWLLPVVQY